jgi:hypothetical protein
VKEYPTELLELCPEKLPIIQMNQGQWDSLTAEQQDAISSSVLGQWANTYFACQARHNKLVKEIENVRTN